MRSEQALKRCATRVQSSGSKETVGSFPPGLKETQEHPGGNESCEGWGKREL